MKLHALMRSLRPVQWLKNLVVLAPLVFAHKLTDTGLALQAVMAFAVFCLISSATYLFNDLRDRDRDAIHPVKRKRPIASGELPATSAVVALLVLGAAGLLLAADINMEFLVATAGYLVLQAFYSLVLKDVILLDVFAVSAGYVIRVVGGAVAISVPASSWLLLCTLLLALFLSLAKRRHEVALLGNGAEEHRKSLVQYDESLLDQLTGVTASATLIAYALYTLDPDTLERFGGRSLSYTVPFVLYGLFRYMYLVHAHKGGGEPDMTLFADAPLLLDVLLYCLVVVGLIYFK